MSSVQLELLHARKREKKTRKTARHVTLARKTMFRFNCIPVINRPNMHVYCRLTMASKQMLYVVACGLLRRNSFFHRGHDVPRGPYSKGIKFFHGFIQKYGSKRQTEACSPYLPTHGVALVVPSWVAVVLGGRG